MGIEPGSCSENPGSLKSQTHGAEAEKPQAISSGVAAVSVVQGLWVPRRQRVQGSIARTRVGWVHPQNGANSVSSKIEGSLVGGRWGA